MATLQTLITEAARYVKADLVTSGTPAVYDTDSAEIVQRLISGINEAKNEIAKKHYPLYKTEGIVLGADASFKTTSLSENFYRLINVMHGGYEVDTKYLGGSYYCDVDITETHADDDLIVTETAMQAAAYTVAAQPEKECLLSFTVTTVSTADTLGTITVVGKLDDVVVTESITPISGITVYSTNTYDEITSLTGVSWVIGGDTADNIKVGVAYTYCTYSYIPDDMTHLKNLVSSDTDDSYPFPDVVDYRILCYKAAQMYYEINGGTSARQKAQVWEKKYKDALKNKLTTDGIVTSIKDVYEYSTDEVW